MQERGSTPVPDVITITAPYDKLCRPRHCCTCKTTKCVCNTILKNTLHKAEKDGLQSLNFKELQNLSMKITDAMSKLSNLPCKEQKRNTLLQDEDIFKSIDKQSLIQRVNALEQDLLKKEYDSNLKIEELQGSIKLEREKLETLKNILAREIKKNRCLVQKMDSQVLE